MFVCNCIYVPSTGACAYFACLTAKRSANERVNDAKTMRVKIVGAKKKLQKTRKLHKHFAQIVWHGCLLLLFLFCCNAAAWGRIPSLRLRAATLNGRFNE